MPALRKYQIGATVCMVSSNRKVLFALKKNTSEMRVLVVLKPNLEFVNNVAYLESRSQLEPQVLHEHGGAQQQQGFAVNFMSTKCFHMHGKGGVQCRDLKF